MCGLVKLKAHEQREEEAEINTCKLRSIYDVEENYVCARFTVANDGQEVDKSCG